MYSSVLSFPRYLRRSSDDFIHHPVLICTRCTRLSSMSSSSGLPSAALCEGVV
ncbi:hypothetical protein BC936DRAFT_148615 [Jimgerdemannia flammicorona]|uniref:Uncharacterized protein n=1 Tax=Jimgerdemannia flammicorona TaxID=994334 RepID=A0A433DKM9_9FUNG|nr:hypothetical protein BC936DRAFT_148615 [Jimgerdemannia flammicorona]